MSRRILAVDPGEKNIGVAISDPTQTLAKPLSVIQHVSRTINAAVIVQIAEDNNAELIIVGQALDMNGEPGFQARKANRLAAAIRTQTQIPVELWDESSSTQAARTAHILQGSPRRKRRNHLDDRAAAAILQSYIDAKKDSLKNQDHEQ